MDTTWNTVDDIGEVCIRQADENPQYNQLTISGEIVSVIYDEHHKCPVCDWKVSMAVAVPQDIMKCSNCSAKFKASKTKKQGMAKLQINDSNITMFTNILSTLVNIAQPCETIEESLLSMDNIKVQINSSNIVDDD